MLNKKSDTNVLLHFGFVFIDTLHHVFLVGRMEGGGGGGDG